MVCTSIIGGGKTEKNFFQCETFAVWPCLLHIHFRKLKVLNLTHPCACSLCDLQQHCFECDFLFQPAFCLHHGKGKGKYAEQVLCCKFKVVTKDVAFPYIHTAPSDHTIYFHVPNNLVNVEIKLPNWMFLKPSLVSICSFRSAPEGPSNIV